MTENKNNPVNPEPAKNNNPFKVVIAIVAIVLVVLLAMKFLPKADDSKTGTKDQVETTQTNGTQANETNADSVENTQAGVESDDPIVVEYIDYLENTKIRDAVALYGEEIYDNPERMEEIRVELLKRIEKVEEAYKDGSMEYNASLDKLRDYGTFRDLSSEVNAARDRIKEMNKAS